MIKAVIFDYGRTLHDPDTDDFFPEAREVLEHCKRRGYKLAIVSYVDLKKGTTPESRTKKLHDAGLAGYFDLLSFATGGPDDKDRLYGEAVIFFKLSPEEVAIVDDYSIRGIAWGNKHGATTIWLRRGKFSDILPTTQPQHTVYSLKEVTSLL